MHTALKELCSNCSPNIVTMVNTLEPYSQWEALCGQGRIVPAFPGAGGSFQGNTLKAALTPRLIQPTTFGEIGGAKTKRLAELYRLFKKAAFRLSGVSQMDTRSVFGLFAKQRLYRYQQGDFWWRFDADLC